MAQQGATLLCRRHINQARVVLPLSAIYIEIYYIFASVWGHKIYTVRERTIV